MRKSRETDKGRRGLTLIEVLTVVAIVGVVASLILAAVVHARRTAHLAACASRLRQIGIAMHSYEATHSRIVPAGGPQDGHHISPHVRLLAFLDLRTVEESVNF